MPPPIKCDHYPTPSDQAMNNPESTMPYKVFTHNISGQIVLEI